MEVSAWRGAFRLGTRQVLTVVSPAASLKFQNPRLHKLTKRDVPLSVRCRARTLRGGGAVFFGASSLLGLPSGPLLDEAAAPRSLAAAMPRRSSSLASCFCGVGRAGQGSVAPSLQGGRRDGVRLVSCSTGTGPSAAAAERLRVDGGVQQSWVRGEGQGVSFVVRAH